MVKCRLVFEDRGDFGRKRRSGGMKDSPRYGLIPSGLIFCAFFTFAAMAFAGTYSGGSGTAEDPYKISTVTDWQELIATSADWDMQFILTTDIDFAGVFISRVEFFDGVFNGQRHVIRNATICQPENDGMGLFGYIDDGYIMNLGVENVNIQGQDSVGGLVGQIYRGQITSCYVTGIVSGRNSVGGVVGTNDWGKISVCYATAAVSGSGNDIGGFVGANEYGAIRSCYARGTVSGNYNVGGFAGTVREGTIESCYSTGIVLGTDSVGGLVGGSGWKPIAFCYAIGPVSGTGDSVGGLTGDSIGMSTSCFWDIQATGQSDSSSGKGLTPEQMKTMTVFQNAGWANGDWILDDGNDTPRLAWENTTGVAIPQAQAIPLDGSGTENNPYRIYTAEEFVLLSCYSGILDQHIRLMADLDLSEMVIDPIGDLGAFAGVFDGNDHTLRHARIYRPNRDFTGLFRYLEGDGRILHLGVDDPNIVGRNQTGGLVGYSSGGTIIDCYATGVIRGSMFVGGLAGTNGGSMTSCWSAGVVDGVNAIGGLVGENSGTTSSCYATGIVTGSNRVGGLTGINSGAITCCYATGSVTGSSYIGGLTGFNSYHRTIESSYATGTVSGKECVGGLVGYNAATITSCYAVGKVSGASSVGGLVGYHNSSVGWQGEDVKITSCYSTGKVIDTGTNHSRFGGLVGASFYGGVISSFWDIQTSEMSYGDDGIGKTTAEMKNQNTFTSAGWDLMDTWWMPPRDYPRLQWEFGHGSLQVTIQPSEAVIEGAQWRRIGTTDWLDSGQTETSVPAVPWKVEFKPTRRWKQPVSIQVFMSANELNQIEAIYAEKYVGNGTQEDPFLISSINDWLTLVQDYSNWDLYYRLNADLDLAGVELVPVGNYTFPFSGKFDGNGHALRNAVINLPDDGVVGLFGYNLGTIHHLRVINVAVTGQYHVGGLVGCNGAWPPNGYTVSHCSVSGTISGGNQSWSLGGLAGSNYDIVDECHSTATVISGDNSMGLGGLCGDTNYGTISNSFSEGAIIGGNESSTLGGLCGYIYGQIFNCYSTGPITSGERSGYIGGLCGLAEIENNINDCYSTGKVICGLESNDIGGLCGYLEVDGIIRNCFWDVETSGLDTSSGGEGKTTAEMKAIATFTSAGWDFVGEAANGTEDVWRMCTDGIDYPRLSWEFSSAGDFTCPDGVSMEDLLYLAERWMAKTAAAAGAADGNGDGTADMVDFEILAVEWMRQTIQD